MSQKPNLIFIMPDQLRADFLSAYGASFIDTPHIDSLAQHGVRYEYAYSASPVCVPARASLLTGMNAIRTGVTDNGQWIRPDYHACGIETWPEMLAANGYYTAAIGKMHFYPWDIPMGFQYRVAAEDKRWLYVRDDYYHFLQENGYRKLHGNEHPGYYENRGAIVNKIPWEYSVDHFVGQEACRFIRNHGQEGPFAMMVGFPGPHCPYDPVPEYLEQFSPEDMPDAIPEVPGDAPKVRQNNIDGNRRSWNGVDYTIFTEAHKKKIRAHYAALVKQIDDEVGRILEALRAENLLENTVIIFSSDHGDYLGDHNLIGKGTFFESSIRVPLIVRLPHVAEARVYDGLVELGDVTATLLAMAGCPIPAYMDSIPLPEIGLDPSRRRERVVGMVSGGWMIDDGTWRLAKYATGEQLLFNRKEDPDEQHNLLHDPQHTARYRALDNELTGEIMRSVTLANRVQRVYDETLSGDPTFGKRSWQRVYPRALER
jgi:arylsulfatase A-like enzyme